VLRVAADVGKGQHSDGPGIRGRSAGGSRLDQICARHEHRHCGNAGDPHAPGARSSGDGHGVGETVGDGFGVCDGIPLTSVFRIVEPAVMPVIRNATQNKMNTKFLNIFTSPVNWKI